MSKKKGLHFEWFTLIFKQEESQEPAKPNRERQSRPNRSEFD